MAAVIPAALLLLFFVRIDKFTEPKEMIAKVFGLGVISTVPAVIVSGLVWGLAGSVLHGALARGFGSAFLAAAIPEEFFKWVVIYCFIWRSAAFDEIMDGLVYGATASLGFATLENILYVGVDGEWLSTAIARSLTAVPAHAMFGALMGYYVALARFAPLRRRSYLWKSLLVPIVLHGLYDFPLLSFNEAAAAGTSLTNAGMSLLILVPLIIGGGWFWAFRLARRLRKSQEEFGRLGVRGDMIP